METIEQILFEINQHGLEALKCPRSKCTGWLKIVVETIEDGYRTKLICRECDYDSRKETL